MLLLQLQNSLRNPRSVIALSCILHVVACFALLFIYKDYHQRLFVDLSSRISSQAVVKLLPLSASRSALAKGGKKGAGSGITTSTQKKKSKAPTTVVKQKVAKKQVNGGKKGAKKKGKNVLQEKKQTKVKEKDKTKSVVSGQKLVEKPKVEESVPPKKEEMPPVESPKVEEQAVVETVQQSGQEGQEIVYLTQQELDALQIHQKLQESIFSVWEAPVGMAAEQYCEVMVAIGWDGAVQETQFLKKTGSLVYDLSVQETIEQVVFPHEVWGKRITIAFKP